MKKSTGLVGVVAVVAVAWLGTTWYVGKEAQTTIEDVVAQANERLVQMSAPDSGVKLEIAEYDRGWFSSDIVYTLHMKDADGKPMALTLQDDLHHGPFPVSALQSGQFMPMLAYSQAHVVATPATQAWVDSQKGGSPLNIETRVGFAGQGHSIWTFAPVEMQEDGDKLNFSGGRLAIDFTNDFKNNDAQGQFASLVVRNDETGEALEIKDLQVNSVTEVDAEGASKVQSAATVAAFTLDEGDGNPAVIDNMAIHFDSSQTGKLLDGALRYEFGRIALGQFELGSISVGGKVEQLDVQAVSELAAEYEAIQTANSASDEDLVLTDEEQARLQQKLLPVLATGPAFYIEPFEWKNEQGRTFGSLQARLAKPEGGSEQPVDVLLGQVLQQLKLDLTVSKPMLVKAFGQAQASPEQRAQMEMMGAMIYDQYMARLEQAGLVQLKDDTAILSLLYQDGTVTVNGREMPVAEFMQRGLSVVM